MDCCKVLKHCDDVVESGGLADFVDVPCQPERVAVRELVQLDDGCGLLKRCDCDDEESE